MGTPTATKSLEANHNFTFRLSHPNGQNHSAPPLISCKDRAQLEHFGESWLINCIFHLWQVSNCACIASFLIRIDGEKLYLLAAPQPLQNVAILMIESGMRCGEVYRIRRQDINLTKAFLQVVRGETDASIQVHLSDRAQNVLGYRIDKFAGENLFPKTMLTVRWQLSLWIDCTLKPSENLN